MRMWTATLVCRLNDEDVPTMALNVDLEDGVPLEFVNMLPDAMRNAADQMAAQLDAGTATVIER